MTAPVQEPTTDRALQGFAYQRDQLLRRPGPIGSSDFPWARIARQFADSNQVISTASYTEIDTTSDWNMGPGESGEYIFTADHSTNALTLEVDGVFLIHARIFWFSAITNTWELGVTNNQGGLRNTAQFGGFGGTRDDEGDFEYHARFEAGTELSIEVYQKDGGNRSVDAAMLDVMLIGTWTGDYLDVMDPNWA